MNVEALTEDEHKGLLTASELAETLGMSVDSVYDLARYHGMPHYRFNRTMRFRLEEVLEWARADRPMRGLRQ